MDHCAGPAADHFDGQLVHLPLQRLAVNRVQASTQDVYRTPAAIAKSKDQPFYLITQIEQPWLVKQGGRVLQLRPGDTVLVDAAQAYELHFPHSVTCLSVQMPRAWVGQWLQTVDLSHARVAHREQGWGAMLSALRLQLGRQPALALEMAPDWLEAQFGALLAASMEPMANRNAAGASDLRERAVALMRERRGEPGWRADELVAQRIRRLVYWNAFVPLDGESLIDLVPPHYVALFDGIAAANNGSVMLPYPIWREAFINDADAALAEKAYGLLNPHPYKTFTDPAKLSTPLAAMTLGKSYINCQQDTALPHSLPWHPRLSERLGLFRLVECSGSHELCFTDPKRLADAIEQAGRD